MAIDIVPNTTFGKQGHIILTCQQAYIIDLLYTRSKELVRSGQ